MSFTEYAAQRSDGREVRVIAGDSADVAALLKCIWRLHPRAEEIDRREAYGWCSVTVLMPEEPVQ